jgi:hypothetical protein
VESFLADPEIAERFRKYAGTTLWDHRRPTKE